MSSPASTATGSFASRTTGRSWLREPWGAALYGLGWLTFAAAYAALFLLTDSPSPTTALRAALFVIGPAAALGIGVVALSQRLSFPGTDRGGRRAALVHVAGAVAFSTLWMVAVSSTRSLVVWMSSGDWNVFSPPPTVAFWHYTSGALIYATLAGLTYAWRGLKLAESRRRSLEGALLRAQINPHFLFNTLHSVSALITRNPEAARQALHRLAELLRTSLRERPATTRLGDEWWFTRNYLQLEGLRLGDRLRLDASLDKETLDTATPGFILQPLAENAIRHAVAPRAAGGQLQIRARSAGEHVQILVADDGPGAAPAAVAKAAGLGLRAVRQRLRERYGSRCSMEIQTAPGQGFRVVIHIPAEE